MRLCIKAALVSVVKFCELRDCSYLYLLHLLQRSWMAGEAARYIEIIVQMKRFPASLVLLCLVMPVASLAETGASSSPTYRTPSSIGQYGGTRLGLRESIMSGGASSSFQTKRAPSLRKALGKVMAPASGNDAAYIAFDQGQYITARRIAEQRAKQNDPQAHTLLGRIYGEGYGVPRNELVAANWYRKGAELGDIEAMFALGVILASGTAVKKNADGAAQMFEQAARKGHVFAHYNLAQLFLSGRGKPENPYRAAQHLEYAARKGVPQAQYDLATLYQRGYGVEPDAYKAAYWLQKAADKGMPAAQFEYAVTLLRGRGLNQDKPKITEYLTAAAKAGIAAAQNRLAHLYHSGVSGTAGNPLLAAKWRWLAKQNGIKDDQLDVWISKYPVRIRREAEAAAQDQQAEAFVGAAGRAQ